MAYTPTRSKDHEQRGPARFLEQFKRSKNLIALLQAYLRRTQEAEDAAWEVILFRNLVDGEGIILDFLGRIVGRQREGLSDTDYRIAIRTQIRINRSVGRTWDVIEVGQLSTPDGTLFRYREFAIATIVVEVMQQALFNVRLMFRNMISAKAGGVRLQLVYSDQDLDEVFTFADFNTASTDADMGLSHPSTTIGGMLMNVLTSEVT